MTQRVRIAGIGGPREAVVLDDLGDGRLRVRFDSGNTKIVDAKRVVGRKRAGATSVEEDGAVEPATSSKPTRPAPPPMMRASQLLPPARPELRAVPKSQGPARSPRYLAFVRARPCVLCGSPPPSHAHHQGPRGAGQKTDDYRTIPLCAVDHDALHAGNRPQLTKEAVAHAQRELLVEYVRGLEGT